jgi:hypothetical protein
VGLLERLIYDIKSELENNVCKVEPNQKLQWVYGCVGILGTDVVSRDNAHRIPWTLSSFDEWKSIVGSKRKCALSAATLFAVKEGNRRKFWLLRVYVECLRRIREMKNKGDLFQNYNESVSSVSSD